MLPFRNRADRSNGGSLECHHPLMPDTTISSFGSRSLRADANKNSLRDRFKSLTGNITRRGISGLKKDRTYMPNPWYPTKSDDDLSGLTSANAQHVEVAGQTWPAIRKSISSMTPSLRANRGSADTSRSAEDAPHQTCCRQSKTGFRVSRDKAKRRVKIETQVPCIALQHSTCQTGNSSCSTISEAVSGHGHERAPRLPRLATPSSFLESLNKTGLFRMFTPSLEANGVAETVKVQNNMAVDSKGPLDSSQVKTSHPSIVNTADASSQTHHYNFHQHHISSRQEKSPTQFSSKLPAEWLDRILETSFTTRNPNLSSLQAIMDFIRQGKNCIFVQFPRRLGVPEPLQCYPGFKAALEDICDRFGQFYAPFAAYNAHTRMITLYASGTTRPESRFVDRDTALFDLHRARSAWVRKQETQASSTDVTQENATHEDSPDEDASPKTPVDAARDVNRSEKDVGRAHQPRTPERQKMPEVPGTPAAPVKDSNRSKKDLAKTAQPCTPESQKMSEVPATPATPVKDFNRSKKDLGKTAQPCTPENQKMPEIPKTPAAPKA